MNQPGKTHELKLALYKPWQALSALLSPTRCPLCAAPVPWDADPLRRRVCADCLPKLTEAAGLRCTGCGLRLGPRPAAFGWTQCRHCRKARKHWGRTLVCADYLPPYDHWLTQLKYGQQLAHANLLSAWLEHNARKASHPRPDVLVPVPCTAHKLKQRGYNQAALIATQLGQLWGVPVDHGVLRKIREVGPQADLNRAERLQNLDGVFVATKALPKEWRIGLVDDVITTSATLQQCTRALRKAGARHVDWFAICRTPE